MIDPGRFATDSGVRAKHHTLPDQRAASPRSYRPFSPMQNSTLRPFRAAAVLGLCVLSSGCFVSRSLTNPSIPAETVAQIVPGESDANDVARLLGAPNEVVQLGRKSAWRYEYTVEKQTALFLVIFGLRGVDTQADRVWVFFDEEDNVSHIGSLLQASEAKYDLPVF